MKGAGKVPPEKGAGKVPPEKVVAKGAGKSPVKGAGNGQAKGPVKVLKWIIILFIPLNLLILLASFAFPGRAKIIDNYQVAVQKMVVHQLDKSHTRKIFRGAQPDTFSAHTIQYAELKPCLDQLQPGSLFFSVHGRRVSKIFIRSEWKHCGIFLGTLQQIEHYWGKEHELVARLHRFYATEDEYLIFDSSYDLGVSIHSIRDMADLNGLPTLRKLLLIEPNLNKDLWSLALQNNISHLEKAYDYNFVLENDDALYCSEFLNEVMDDAFPLKNDYFQPSAKIAGRPLLLPSDIVDAILGKGVSSGDFIMKGCILKKEGVTLVQSLQ